MNKEELDSFEELNIDLRDIDDLDMGLEIISYKVRKSLQELADIIINQSCQISTYKDKEEKIRELFKDYNTEKPASGLSQCTYEITAEDMYKLLQILNDKVVE